MVNSQPQETGRRKMAEPAPQYSLTQLAGDVRYSVVPKQLRRMDLSLKVHNRICIGQGEPLNNLTK